MMERTSDIKSGERILHAEKDCVGGFLWRLVGCLVVLIASLFIEGCSSSAPRYTTHPTPSTHPAKTEEKPEPSAYRTYTYRAVTDDCNCEEYKKVDARSVVEYRFRARYTMDSGIHTSIEIEVTNNSDDTLWFDHGTAKVSSRNVPYQYNDRFIPLPDLTILPKKSETVKLTGNDRSDENDWHKIAGEQLTITIRGLRMGEKEIAPQAVTFVPENPMMKMPGK
jgi:hypothetical protein